ncbi:hypothetical protein [uncultured Dokdonia sp.]
MLPTTAASVLDSIGSAIPAISAGMASCCIRLNEISILLVEVLIGSFFK